VNEFSKITNRMNKRWFFVFLALLGLQVAVHGQARVVANLSSNKAFVGNPILLTVQAISPGETFIWGNPTFQIPGVFVEGPFSNTVININGFQKMVPPIQFRLTPNQSGEFTVPAFEVNVAGEVLTTTPATFTVTEAAAAAETPLAMLSVGKTTLWEGERGLLELGLYIPRGSQIQELPLPSLVQSDFAMNRFTRGNRQDMQEIEGRLYDVYAYRTEFYGLKTGELKMGPAKLKGEFFVATRGISPLGMRNLEPRKYEVESNQVPVIIKPLPEAGKPAKFSGAVGQFQLAARVEQTRVTQGDPLTVLLFVQGNGNYETLEPPTLSSSEGWRSYDARVVRENRAQGQNNDVLVYSQVIEPLAVHRAIPAFELPYFDPVAGAYKIARSDELPISITPASKSPAAAAGMVGAQDFGKTALPLPQEQLAGLLGPMPSLGSLQSIGMGQTRLPLWSSLGLVHGLPLAIAVGLVGWSLYGRLDSHRRRAAAAADTRTAASVLRELRAATNAPPASFFAKATQFLELWEKQHPGSSLPDAELAGRVRRNRDFFCYSGKTPDSALEESPENPAILAALEKWPA
jgi:hypothetical protein